MSLKKIVIIGGGITGLSAAYYLQKEIKADQLPYEVKLVEASKRFGGKIKTMKREDFTIEQGPDSLLSRKPAAMKLVEELGLQDEVIRNSTGQSYILLKNKLHKMPLGTFMGIPKEKRSLAKTGLVSAKGKIRALGEPMIPKSKIVDDQSLGFFMRRRFGNEVVDNLISPLLSGIHSGDIDDMSLMAAFPNFYHLEQKYGSLMKGLRESMPSSKKENGSGDGKKPAGIFFSFKNGLETLVHRLVEEIGQDTLSVNVAVDHIEKKDHGYYCLLSNGMVYEADAVIMATPHTSVSKIFSQYDFFKMLNDIPATSTANVVLAFDQSALKRDMDGTGFQVSRNSNYHITACTWTNKKWPTTTPDGKILLRCYVGRPSEQAIVDLPDEKLIEVVLNDLRKVMKIKGKPEFTEITRFRNARPQYNVGHLERVKTVRDQVSETLPGVQLIGSSYDGAGIPDCIGHGEEAAADALEFLRDK